MLLSSLLSSSFFYESYTPNVLFETLPSVIFLYLFSLLQNNPTFFKDFFIRFSSWFNFWNSKPKAKLVLISYIKQIVKYSFMRNSEMSNATKGILWYIQKNKISVKESQEILMDNEELYFRPVHEYNLCIKDDIYCNIYQKEFREEKNKGQNIYMEYTIEVCGDSYHNLASFIQTCYRDMKNDIDKFVPSQKYFIFDGIDEDNYKNGLKFREFDHRSLIKYEQHLNDNQERIHNILEQFENVNWYSQRNKSRNCAFIFHGEPGCGKTQTQCSIFNRYDGKHYTDDNRLIQLRHIIMVPLDKINSKESFHEILHGSYINDKLIPPERRLIFFSESDTQQNFLAFMDRSLYNNKMNSNKNHILKNQMIDTMLKSMFNTKQLHNIEKYNSNNIDGSNGSNGIHVNSKNEHNTDNDNNDNNKEHKQKINESNLNYDNNTSPIYNEQPLKCNLTLGDVLISLDGVQKREGTMLFFDTNHFHLWDKALLRHSRIDYIIEFKKCSREIVRKILLFYFHEQSNENQSQYDFSKIKENYWTYSDLDSVVFENHHDLKKCVDILSNNHLTK